MTLKRSYKYCFIIAFIIKNTGCQGQITSLLDGYFFGFIGRMSMVLLNVTENAKLATLLNQDASHQCSPTLFLR